MTARGIIRSLIFSGAMVFAALGPAAAEKFTLEQALASAYQTNPRLLSARASLRASDEGVAQANAGWKPKIAVTGSYGTSSVLLDGLVSRINNHPGTLAVELNENIFDGGATYSGIRRSKALVRAGRANLTSVEQNVLLDTVAAYLDVVLASNVLTLSQSYADSLKRQVSATQTQLNAGAVTRTDLLESQSRYAAAQSAFSAARARLFASQMAFGRVVGQPPGTLSQPFEPRAFPASLDAVIMAATSANPDLVRARETERAADFAIGEAFSTVLPHVSVSMAYQYQHDAFGLTGAHTGEQALQVTGSVTIPIYQGGADTSAVREAREVRSQAQLAVVDIGLQVRQLATNAWNNYLAARDQAALSAQQVAASGAAVESVTQEQQAGERSILDILNAQQELFTSQLAVANAQHDVVLTAYTLLGTMGQLTARNLRLAVRFYDPIEHYDETTGILGF